MLIRTIYLDKIIRILNKNKTTAILTNAYNIKDLNCRLSRGLFRGKE